MPGYATTVARRRSHYCETVAAGPPSNLYGSGRSVCRTGSCPGTGSAVGMLPVTWAAHLPGPSAMTVQVSGRCQLQLNRYPRPGSVSR